MAKNNKSAVWALGLLFLAALALWAVPAVAEMQPATNFEVVTSADVTNYSYAIKKYKGKNRLHVTVEIKNVAKVPKRFRVNIWLPDGVAGGGFYPRKKKAIEPGKTLSRTFPMYYDKMPDEATILVKELPTD
ncbi:MAG: hypothetical protein K9K66_06495 [Desulfarculaceae bacterium]|nr:hypothetical protein [Desulfarculaceae bacterium]MCF8071109.1 hypothetical protein [Desulfarculaceae bacterium]MCF8101288.1 hypothetical protein [Desulfarculaceae bacterium]MCF8115163.1 hypothetical protein [Desulfarculaceae bacterium]